MVTASGKPIHNMSTIKAEKFREEGRQRGTRREKTKTIDEEERLKRKCRSEEKQAREG